MKRFAEEKNFQREWRCRTKAFFCKVDGFAFQEEKQRIRALERHRIEIEETAQKLRDDHVSKTETEMEKEENREMAYEEQITRLAVT